MTVDTIALREESAGETLLLSPPARLTALAGLIVAATALFHISALEGWWVSDDPQILLHARHLSTWQIFFSPHHWRLLSSSNFTPLVTLSFKVDLALFGLDPRGFFVHQLIDVALAAILLFLLVRRYASSLAGAIAAMLFIISPQTILLARSLMLRHYLEGLVLALGALLIWDHPRWPARAPWFAAAFYLGALCAKEIYAPLPLFFLFLSWRRGDRLRKIIRDLVPSALVAVLYIIWRRWMLGSAGGYGVLALRDIMRLPLTIASASLGHQPWEVAIISAVLLSLIVLALRESWKAAITLLVVTSVGVMLPLIPVAGQFESRYAMLASVALITLAGLAAASRWRGALYLYALLFFPLLAAGQSERILVESQHRLLAGEGHYVSERPPTAPTLLAGAPGWYLGGLTQLRRELKGEPSPSVMLSAYPLYLNPDSRGVVQCIDECREVAPINAALGEEALRRRARFRSDLPVRASLEKKGDDLYWELQPSRGEWVFLSFPDYDDYPMPARGWRRLPESDERQSFRLYHGEPDGSWTISPPLELPAGGRIVWQNGSLR